jgi:hypothetical protein
MDNAVRDVLVVSLNHAREFTLLHVTLDGRASILLSGSNPRILAAVSFTGRTLSGDLGNERYEQCVVSRRF